jgi:hypothetical protein
MVTKSAPKQTSQGECVFCQREFVKAKMSQHLKSCKQRQATIEAQEKTSQQPKKHLFHILAEGRYDPAYWLHFEVPADAPLWLLDSFLKDMWIEDLDHLSSFTINGVEYDVEEPSYGLIQISDKEGEEDKRDEEAERQEIKEIVDNNLDLFVGEHPLFGIIESHNNVSISDAWIEEIKKPRTFDEMEAFLKDALVSATQEYRAAIKEARNNASTLSMETRRMNAIIAHIKESTIDALLASVQDRSMNAALNHVLKVGQKFSYIYDFGSSTHINLKVIAEREGIVADKQKPAQLLAQNTASKFSCIVCGKPATQVLMEDVYDSLADATFCDACSKKQDYKESWFPIINSPRVGVL